MLYHKRRSVLPTTLYAVIRISIGVTYLDQNTGPFFDTSYLMNYMD